MSGSNLSNCSDLENTCVVCFKNADIYSVGICDHPVCYECSTRMRVLCDQLECPICRQTMPKVIFTREVQPFATLESQLENQNLQDLKYGVYFSSSAIQRHYYRLLEHECFICKKNPFRMFKHLKEHMKQVHELYYCELCVKNLKIFTFERKCYKRSELSLHRRKGDVDNTSHRGHPLCQFCDIRFVDNDELFRHLRRDHLYCHFCDADGKHQYYNVYSDLRKHYSEEHYLCEEGDCKNEQFTSVFRTDIDLKAHYATAHSRSLSKAANRQARTLELEFTLKPRARGDGGGRGIRHYSFRRDERPNDVETYYPEPGGSDGINDEFRIFNNPLAAENFPSLSGEANTAPSRAVSNVTITSKINPFSNENFPSLGQPAVTITRTVRNQQGLQFNSANFPVLGDNSTTASSGSLRLSVNNIQERPSTTKAPNVSIHLNHNSNGAITTRISQSSNGSTVSVNPKAAEAFPALNSSSEPIRNAQWVPQKPKKQEPKVSKVAAAPILTSNSLNDFPTLNKGGISESRKSSSVTMPVSNVWVNLNNFNNDNKKSNNNEAKLKQEKANEKKIVPKNMKASNSGTDENKNKKRKKIKKTTADADMNELSVNVNKIAISEDSPVEDDHNENNAVVNNMVNGVAKKRSELNIDPLEVTSPPVVKPPPGINVKPPPGFSNFNLSDNISSNHLTFTNSTGQSYSIMPSHQFCRPPNFKMRNQSLIESLKTVLHDADVIQHFKMYSDMFRAAEISPEKYYEYCREFMGEKFATIFPELLVLLPDIEKQQDLYKVHRINSATKGLEICGTCKQIVLINDLRNHLSNHTLDNHFPVLNLNQTNAETNIWNKK